MESFQRLALRVFYLPPIVREPGTLVLDVAATMPCDKADLAEAMLPFFLVQYPPDVAAKIREEMRAAGYDETKPNVAAKFLNLLSENS